MQPPPDIVIIAGTNRPGSLTQVVADYYAEQLAQLTSTTLQQVNLSDLPDNFATGDLYTEETQSAAFQALIAPVLAAPKLIFILPEYQGSFPGVLKAFLDGIVSWREFAGKKCALAGVSAGSLGGALAMSHLTDVLNYLDASVYPTKLRIANVTSPTRKALLEKTSCMPIIEQQLKGFLDF